MIAIPRKKKPIVNPIYFIVATLASAICSLTSSVAVAVPVQGQFQDNPNFCDSHPTQNFGHELGDVGLGFPVDEGLMVTSINTPQLACVADDGAPNDFLVTISNVSPFSYKDLFFVADDGVGIGNIDGGFTDLNTPGFTDAFKIDNVGANNNLVSGDVNNNLLLDPGELWQFLLTNFVTPASTPPGPIFGSIGGFAASSQPDPISNASILANRIPEPGSAMLLANFGFWLAVSRKRK